MKDEILKGNFKTQKKVTDDAQKAETNEDKFEREAKKRLGGSICYVSKKKVMWDKNEK